MRGTQKHTRAELRDAFDKLKASVSVGGDGASIEVRRANLDDDAAPGRPRCCASPPSRPPSSRS